jgi:hypothetical protein
MRITSLAVVAVVLGLSATAGASAPQEKPADVSGAWSLTVETAQGTGTPGVTFKQDGEALTGTYSSQFFGEQPVTGTVKGNRITFSFTATVEDNAIPVTFTGTVDGDAMKGEIAFGDFGGGMFTGKRTAS